MKILVTGGAGYIGGQMVHSLLDNGFNVSVIDNLTTGNESTIPKSVEFIEEDIGAGKKITKYLKEKKIDAVFHFAASIKVEESELNPLKYFKNNFCETRAFLDSCVEANIKFFVFSSTAAVYGNSQSQLSKENDILAPNNNYGLSKLFCEQMIEKVFQFHQIKYCILRYFNVAGSDLRLRTGQLNEKPTHLISVACHAALGLIDSIPVFGTDYDTKDGTAIRDYIHVVDLVDAHLKALEYLEKDGASGIFNCGYGHGYSVYEVIDTLKKITGKEIKKSLMPRRKGDVESLVANNLKIMSQFKWEPKLNSLIKILNDNLSWEKKKISKNKEK